SFSGRARSPVIRNANGLHCCSKPSLSASLHLHSVVCIETSLPSSGATRVIQIWPFVRPPAGRFLSLMSRVACLLLLALTAAYAQLGPHYSPMIQLLAGTPTSPSHIYGVSVPSSEAWFYFFVPRDPSVLSEYEWWRFNVTLVELTGNKGSLCLDLM